MTKATRLFIFAFALAVNAAAVSALHVAMVHGAGYPSLPNASGYAGVVPVNTRLGIPALYLADSPVGVGNGSTSGGVGSDSVDFGGQVVYSKSGTNPQGQLTFMIHSMNKPDGTQDGKQHLYYVKSNSIASLAFVGDTSSLPKTASFTAKTNVYELLPGGKTGLDGGGTMQFMFTQPGGTYTVTTGTGSSRQLTCPSTSTGCASVIVYKSTGGVWFSSAWGPVTTGGIPQTVEKTMLPNGITKIS